MTTIEYAKRQTREELERRITDYKKRLDAWDNVQIVNTKDGKPFKVMQKNFIGATYQHISYLISNYAFELVVYGKYPNYVKDEYVNCYCYVDDMKKDDKRLLKTENITPKETLVRQVYRYDFFDIVNAINNRKEQIRKQITEYENDLKIVDKVITTFGAKIEKIKNDFKVATHCDKYNSSLYYIIKETKLFDI